MNRPLIRNASRVLVVVLGLLACALALASAYFIIETARSSQQAPEEETVPMRAD